MQLTRSNSRADADETITSDQEISVREEALNICPPGHPDRPMSLNNLASALQSHYKQSGQTVDLDRAISLCEEALNLCPPGHPDRPMSLNSLASTLQSRYKQSSQMIDLDRAISLCEEALNLCPPGHPDRPMSLNNFASALQSRYKQSSQMIDLDRAISLREEALDLYLTGHPDRPMSLNSLASTLQSRYKQSGGMVNLDSAEGLNHGTAVPIKAEIQETDINIQCSTIAATGAMKHAQSNIDRIHSILMRRGTLMKYVIGVGFNEELMRSSGEFLEEIHVSLISTYPPFQPDDDEDRQILMELAHVFSPFPAFLQISDTKEVKIPVLNNDGHVLSWAEVLINSVKSFIPLQDGNRPGSAKPDSRRSIEADHDDQANDEAGSQTATESKGKETNKDPIFRFTVNSEVYFVRQSDVRVRLATILLKGEIKTKVGKPKLSTLCSEFRL
jgi:tetratricopeptide (TPR) repeat protein